MLRIGRADGGKPVLAGRADVRFSVAHSADAAAVAVARGLDVGVDVELRRRRLRRAERLAKRFSDGEYAALRRISGGDEERLRGAVLELWTRKEAFVKCTGEGIRRDLRSFEMAVGPEEEPRLLTVDGSSEAAGRWSVRSLHSSLGEEDVFCTLVVGASEVESLKVIDL